MRFLLITLLCVFSVSAYAQDYKTILDLPQGSSLVSLSATERADIEQDLLVAQLRYETENVSARELQNAINEKMQDALDEAKKVSSVKASTQQYHVYEYDKNRGKKGLKRDTVWKGQQGLMVKGKEADDLLELVGELQKMGLQMSSLNYQVSPELLEETRDGLLEGALKKLKAKAERTAQAIGKSKAELKQINIDMGNYQPRPPVMRTAAMAEGMAMDMAAPVAAPKETQVTLTVNAQALLK